MQLDAERLLRYDLWANLQTLESLRGAASPPIRAMEILGHIVAVHKLFIARVRQESSGEVWPGGDLAGAELDLHRTHEAWQAILSATPPHAETRYVNSKGEQWSSQLGDVIAHLVIHSGYHRGQIALLLGSAGETPAYTDFIQASRSGMI